ncbi:hypothetical protein PMAYCL1PPCAC_15425, partial [Pristionchus mayeri]
DMIEEMELVLLYLSLLFGILTLLIIIILLIIITSKRFKLYTDSFFAIFALGCVYNAVSLVNLNVGATVTSLGWMPVVYTQTNVTVQLFFFFVYFSRCGEVITTILIALNRMTAIFLPFRHTHV